jgi:hypothetical protein
MKRVVLFATSLVLISTLSGCVIPFGYPRLECTLPVKVESEGNDVHAFRVDFTRSQIDIGAWTAPGGETLAEVPVTASDRIPAQIKSSLTYGVFVIGIAVNYFVETDHWVALRLYRPGFELVEIRSCELANRVLWKLAPGLEAQEKALDALFAYPEYYGSSPPPAHKAALLFGASEYERLASLAIVPEQRKRLADKAKSLRDNDMASWRQYSSQPLPCNSATIKRLAS